MGRSAASKCISVLIKSFMEAPRNPHTKRRGTTKSFSAIQERITESKEKTLQKWDVSFIERQTAACSSPFEVGVSSGERETVGARACDF